MKIEDEIKQPTFETNYHKAHVNLLFTAAWLNLKLTQVLKPYGLTHQQFNVLRILRGSSPAPMNIREITERMIDKASNASRLVDKLQMKRLVGKASSENDGRQVQVQITDIGIDVVARASDAVMQQLAGNYNLLSEEEAISLSDTLDKLRQ